MNKLTIGSLHVDNNVLLAPMAGITDAPYREICREHGCMMTFTEMVSAKGMAYGSEATRVLWQKASGEDPWCVQLFGREESFLVRAARELEDAGVQLIDINMGCPAPKIAGNGEGSALLREPELAESLVRAVVHAVRIPVTVKFRKGWARGENIAVSFGRRMEQAGAAALTLHGRTREDFYAGHADWDSIAALKAAVSVPVIGNGDALTAEAALAMLEQTQCDGVMIARGAHGNPWIFSQIDALRRGEEIVLPTPQEKARMAIRHARMLCAHKGEYTGMREMRAHLAAYWRGMPGAAALRAQMGSLCSVQALEELLCAYV